MTTTGTLQPIVCDC